jgi:hypothetical protein
MRGAAVNLRLAIGVAAILGIAASLPAWRGAAKEAGVDYER